MKSYSYTLKRVRSRWTIYPGKPERKNKVVVLNVSDVMWKELSTGVL